MRISFRSCASQLYCHRFITPHAMQYQLWKNVLWGMLRRVYGHLGHGRGIITSALTFEMLPAGSGMPALFVKALQAWGNLPTR